MAYETLAECREVMQYCADELGRPELADRIILEWSNRMTATIGRADSIRMIITLSTKLWDRADNEERMNTIAHEFCHIWCDVHYPTLVRAEGKQGHGDIWHFTMNSCGFTPTRYHAVSNQGLRRKPRRYNAYCGCQVHQITGQRVAKMRKGWTYSCRNCGDTISLRKRV